jgi:hypothetical protein
MSIQGRRNISLAHMGNGFILEVPRLKTYGKGKTMSQEARIKMSLAKKGKNLSPSTQFKVGHNLKHSQEVKDKIRQSLMGHKVKEETKEKLKIATRKYLLEKGLPFLPTIGTNETIILDNLEKTLGYRIVRQLCIEGFFLDGYIPELNLAIEIDEEYHNRKTDRDKIREAIIKNKLGCTFLRVKD